MSVYQNINGSLARIDASDLVQLAAVDTEGILGGTPGAVTNGQTLVDQLAEDDVQAQTDIGQIKTDLSGYHVTPSPNLLDNTLTSQTINGVTVTVNADKSVSLSGTATANIRLTVNAALTLTTGTYYLSGCPTGGANNSTYWMYYRNKGADEGSGLAINITEATYTQDVVIAINSGVNTNGLVFKPMIKTAADYAADPSYVPHWECMRDGKLDIADEQVLGAYNLADCDMATSTSNGFTATKGTLNNGVTYTITGADTGSTGAQFIIEDDAKFLAQMKRYAGKRLKLVGCPADGNSTSGYFLAVYFNYGAGDTPSSFYDLGEGNVMTVPATVNTARLAITLRHAATFSNTVFRPMVTPVLSATYADFVGFAMTNRELTAFNSGYNFIKFLYAADGGTVYSGDLNDLHAGYVYFSTSASNIPVSAYGYCLTLERPTDYNYAAQIAVTVTLSNLQLFVRQKRNHTWESWKTVTLT